MTTISTRRVHGAEYFETSRKVADYAFGKSPTTRDTSRDAEILPLLEPSRAFVTFEGDEPLATATLIPMTQNVRGAVLSMSGVGGVATAPEARRRGHIRSLFQELFTNMREQGEVVTTLYPFRESFYEKLGYAPMFGDKVIKINPAHLARLGRVERIGTTERMMIADGYNAWRTYLESRQRQMHGFSLFEPLRNSIQKVFNRSWLVLARNKAGEIAGALTYKIEDYLGTLEVGSFLYDDPNARQLLLEFLGRHVDQVETIKIWAPEHEQPENWSADLYAEVANAEKYFTTPMGRVLDVSALNGLQVGSGDVALEILDPQCPWNSETWTFRSVDGQLEVHSGGTAQASISIQALSALIYTGHDPANFRMWGWGDPDEVTAQALRNLFPEVRGYLYEAF